MNIDLDTQDARLELADHVGLDIVTDGELDRAWLAAVLLPSSPSSPLPDHSFGYDVELVTVRIQRQVGFFAWIEERQVRRVTPR